MNNSAHLSPRQREILLWAARGKSNEEIGGILGLSPLTVKNHMQLVLKSLNVTSRVSAAIEGIRLGYLTLDMSKDRTNGYAISAAEEQARSSSGFVAAAEPKPTAPHEDFPPAVGVR
ncbi:MAG: helix-turn-helix transcriptional regulator [Candidatus Liptonbacteria bacterium]|nr:helix-turn-helix transcriptional regulator [Candidatus Liptonbacteria bacterium]